MDGTLTDGRLWFGEMGEVSKAFNAKDGPAARILERVGVETGVLTGRDDEATSARADELGWKIVGVGSRDKVGDLAAYAERNGYGAQEILFCGDDEGDAAAMAAVGVGAAPADAHPVALAAAGWVLKVGGGGGVLREIADAVAAAK